MGKFQEVQDIPSRTGRSLRSGQSQIGVIFPNIQEPYYEKLFSGIKHYFTYHSIPYSLYLTNENTEKEMDIISDLLGSKANGIIIYSCNPEQDQLNELLSHTETPLLFLDRKPLDYDGNYVSSDNFALFSNLVDFFYKAGRKDLILLRSTGSFQETDSAEEGFRHGLRKAGLEPQLLFAKSARESGFKSVFEHLQKHKEPEVLLCTSFQLAEGARYAMKLRGIELGERTVIVCPGDSIEDVFSQDDEIIKTPRNAFGIGFSAAELLAENCRRPRVFEQKQVIIRESRSQILPEYFIRKLNGTRDVIVENNGTRKLKLLVVQDSITTASLQNMMPIYEKELGLTVELVSAKPKDYYSFILSELRDQKSDVDLVLFDIPWLEYLSRTGLILPVDSYFDESTSDFSHIIPELLTKYGSVDDKLYAMPIVASTQLMFYRKDLFDDEVLQRQFEKTYQIPLEVPRNWAHYNSICEFFTKSSNPGSPTNYGTAMDLSYAEEVMAAVYPRLWTYGGELYNYKMHPTFNTPEFRNAIKNLFNCILHTDPTLYSDAPADTITKMIRGDVATVITYYNYFTPIIDNFDPSLVEKIGWAPIPGGQPILGGWSMGISKNCKYPRRAFDFIRKVEQRRMAVPSAILGGQSSSTNVYQNFDIISLYPWLTLGQEQLLSARKRSIPEGINPRIFSIKQQEDILYKHIQGLLDLIRSNKAIDSYLIEQALLASEKEASAILNN